MNKTTENKRYVWHVVDSIDEPQFYAVFDTTRSVGEAVHSCGFYMIASFDNSVDLVEVLYFQDAMNKRDEMNKRLREER